MSKFSKFRGPFGAVIAVSGPSGRHDGIGDAREIQFGAPRGLGTIRDPFSRTRFSAVQLN